MLDPVLISLFCIFYINLLHRSFIDLTNIAVFLNLAFCYLKFLLSFSATRHNSVLRSIYGFKNTFCLNSMNFFNCSVTLNKVLRLGNGVSIFYELDEE